MNMNNAQLNSDATGADILGNAFFWIGVAVAALAILLFALSWKSAATRVELGGRA